MLYAALSVGSLTGIVGYGVRPWPGTGRHRLTALTALLSLAVAGCAFLPGVGLLAVGLFTVGAVLGPTGVCVFALVEQLAPQGAAVEAFTTVIAAGLATLALGTAAGGVVVDRAGPPTALLLGATVGLVAAVGLIGRRSSIRTASTAR